MLRPVTVPSRNALGVFGAEVGESGAPVGDCDGIGEGARVVTRIDDGHQ